MFSNKYIFIYTTVLVVAVAVILALAATLLQPMQTRNEEVAKMQEILKAAGETVTPENAKAAYNKTITAEWMVDRRGEIIVEYTNTDGEWEPVGNEKKGQRAFDCNLKTEMEKAIRYAAGTSKEDGLFPVFVCENGQSYIVPLQGKGLWGPVWGYLAVRNDFNTVLGVTFGHKGETPGLGAEIAGDDFQTLFVGKKLFDEDGNFKSITVQKGGAEKYPGDISHAVDAISGGTITSNGVTSMLSDCLIQYEPFLKRMKRSVSEKEKNEIAADSIPVPAAAVYIRVRS